MADFRIKAIVGELWQSGPGKAGIIMIVSLIIASLLIILIFPLDFGSSRWGNPSVWADNPKSSPPVWANIFYRENRARHVKAVIETPDETSATSRAIERVYRYIYDLKSDLPPTFISLSVSDVTYTGRPPVVTWVVTGPDGREISLDRLIVSGPRSGEDGPYRRYEEDPRRNVVGTDERVIDDLRKFFSDTGYGNFDGREIEDQLIPALFGVPDPEGHFEILTGSYRFEAYVLVSDESDTIGSLGLVIGGGVYGVMGTDALGRNLAAGLLFGLPVALLIGLATSTVSTLLGMTLGMLSGYSGGWIDLVIQRAADIVANIPVLPLLIFLVFIGGSKLWLILLVLVAFSWPGLTIMVRTMVLQLRTGQEVEATKALGAKDGRIIVRHILPHAASYVLAQLVFFAPSAILAEAGLSFLGLGDPRIPTWGQILEYGFRTGAVFLGYWWWIVPPGILIIITAVTFMFLALGLEPVVDPRLRGRRSWHF